MRIFRNKPFTRFARRARITDADLREAISDIERGLIDADLGGGVIKQRIARKGGGKSGGFRVVILLKVERGRSSSTVSRKAIATTFAMMNSWR